MGVLITDPHKPTSQSTYPAQWPEELSGHSGHTVPAWLSADSIREGDNSRGGLGPERGDPVGPNLRLLYYYQIECNLCAGLHPSASKEGEEVTVWDKR